MLHCVSKLHKVHNFQHRLLNWNAWFIKPSINMLICLFQQDLRKSTGIPSKFLVEVSDPSIPGVMINSSGKFVRLLDMWASYFSCSISLASQSNLLALLKATYSFCISVFHKGNILVWGLKSLLLLTRYVYRSPLIYNFLDLIVNKNVLNQVLYVMDSIKMCSRVCHKPQ